MAPVRVASSRKASAAARSRSSIPGQASEVQEVCPSSKSLPQYSQFNVKTLQLLASLHRRHSSVTSAGDTTGALAPGIEVVCVPLPAKIQAEVD
jgi:hypothetical protein